MTASKGKSPFNPELLNMKRTEMVLKATKEVVIKFIETGKVSPVSFDEVFKMVFASVNKAVASTLENPSGQK